VPVEMWKKLRKLMNNKAFNVKKTCGKPCGKHV
jgi:hypothetical protein